MAQVPATSAAWRGANRGHLPSLRVEALGPTLGARHLRVMEAQREGDLEGGLAEVSRG